jgi:phosphatidylinositol 4-kinase
MLRIAWAESPGLAIQLSTRFSSGKLSNDVRKLLLSFPEKAINEPSSLEILFGSALPADVSSQLKVGFTSPHSLVIANRFQVFALLGSCQSH